MMSGELITPSVRLMKPIGRGGMGTVWLAEHLVLDTRVVVTSLNTHINHLVRTVRWGLLLRPLGRFLTMYVVRRGFLDGWRGFLLATLYAYYVLIRSAKIWERTKG